MSEEHKILTYIEATRPELVVEFQARIAAGRRGILHRLMQAIVRENIAGLGARSHWQEEGEVLCIDLFDGSTLRIPVERRYSLGRFDLGAGSIWLRSRGGEYVEIEHPVQLVDLLDAEGVAGDEAGVERLLRFRHEMENSAANLALALAGAEVRRQRLAVEAKTNGCHSSLAYARQQTAEDDTFSPLAFFEQWVVEGHPLHPGAKIKMGLDVADVIAYSPEWGATPDVVLVAVRREACRYTSFADKTPSDVLYADDPQLRAGVEAQLAEFGLRAEEYELIPMHPWQHDHTLPALYADALDKQEIVSLPTVRIATTALMSFRSLAPFQTRGAGKHHIKTAVNVQTTGAVRTVSPNSTQNGPLLSQLLKNVQDRERGFDGRFHILREEVGIYYRPVGGEDPVLGKNLAAILRENPEDHVADGELAMAGSALLARSPIGGKLIVVELVEAFAQTRGMTDPLAAAVAFVREYAEVALPGFLTLMSRYGVALEGHLQNSVAVFRNGVPERMIVRDFGGVRILRDRIARQGLQADFYPGSATIIDDVEDMRNKIYYPVFQNHFGELLLSIVRSLGVEEQQLWSQVADVCKQVFAELKADAKTGQQAAEDEVALFAPTLDLKAMATMRILGDVTSYTFAKVPNPLFEHVRVARAHR